MIRFKYCILLLLTALSVRAAAVRGFIYDAETDRPLPGCHVRITGSNWITSSDEEGRFELEDIPAGIYRLEVSCVGYCQYPVTIKLQEFEAEVRMIRLNPSVVDLQEVTVEVDQVGTMVFESSEIRRSVVDNLGTFLEKNSGLNILDGGGAREARISLRGSKPGQVAVYLDGHKLNDPMTGEVDLKTIPLANIDQIVVKPHADLAEGANGSGGSVELKSSTNSGMLVTSEFGSFGYRNYLFDLGRGFGKHDLRFSIGLTSSSGDFPFQYNEGSRIYRENNDYRNKNVYLNYASPIGSGKLDLSFHHFSTDRGAPGTIINPATLDRIERENTGFAGNIKWGSENFDYSFNSSYYETGASNRSYYFFGGDTVEYQADYSTSAGELSLQVSHAGMKGNSTAGFDYRIDRVSSSTLADEEDRIDLGGFVRKSLSFRKLFITGALRVDSYRNFASYISSNLSLRITPFTSRKIVFTGNYSQGTTLPTFNELFYVEDVFAAPNVDLKPELVETADVGIELSGKSYFLKTTLFRRTIKDMIIWQESVTTSGRKWKPFNNDRALIEGLEFYCRMDVGIFELNSALTLSDPRNKSNGYEDNFLVFQPILQTSESISFKPGAWRFSLSHRYTSRRYLLQSNTKWVEPASIFDLAAGREFVMIKWQGQIIAGVDNIFDESYSIVRNSPMPGRSYKISFQFTNP